jgi:hypothetical protein
MMNETKYLFTPRSRDRCILPLIEPVALEKEAIDYSDQWGRENLKPDSRLTLARDCGGNMILARIEGSQKIVLVEKADVKEVTSWA